MRNHFLIIINLFLSVRTVRENFPHSAVVGHLIDFIVKVIQGVADSRTGLDNHIFTVIFRLLIVQLLIKLSWKNQQNQSSNNNQRGQD